MCFGYKGTRQAPWVSTTVLFSSEPPAKQKKLAESSIEGFVVDEGEAPGSHDTVEPSDVSKELTTAPNATGDDAPGVDDSNVTKEGSTLMPTPTATQSSYAGNHAEVPTPHLATQVQPPSVPPGLPQGFGAPKALDSTLEEKGTVSALYVGRVIGKGG